MKKFKQFLTGVMVFVLSVCATFVSPINVRAEEWYGELKTTYGATTFFGEKEINFVLPTPRIYDFRNDNIISVSISKKGVERYTQDVEFTQDEWDAKEIPAKITIRETGKFTVGVGDKKFKVKIKKASAIKAYTPNPEYAIVNKDGKDCVAIRGLDVGSKAKIYRSVGDIDHFELVKTTDEGEFIDTDVKSGKLYYYQVCFIAKDGKKTYNSKFSVIQGWSL